MESGTRLGVLIISLQMSNHSQNYNNIKSKLNHLLREDLRVFGFALGCVSTEEAG
jgi:hypothetical protein